MKRSLVFFKKLFIFSFTLITGIQHGRNRPQGAILCVMEAMLWFTWIGGRSQFPGGRLLQV